MPRKRLQHIYKIQAVWGAGWRRHQYGVEIDGVIQKNVLGNNHPFKTDRAAVAWAMKFLGVKMVEVLPTKTQSPTEWEKAKIEVAS